jgi:hypothetical protein
MRGSTVPKTMIAPEVRVLSLTAGGEEQELVISHYIACRTASFMLSCKVQSILNLRVSIG